MADNTSTILDPYGRPIVREVLTREIAGPTITGIRSPYTGYPGDGLNPRRLASILREADQGDPVSYFELAEQIEERDMHYTGVLATRKRSVAQLEIHVDPADATPDAKAMADTITAWLKRKELQEELFDMLDAIGKGMSYTEIVWDTSTGQWIPARLERRDQRWFKPDRRDGVTPLLRTDAADAAGWTADSVNGFGYVPQPPFKFINTVIRAKSGLPIRSGIARLAAWSWMFKAFTLRDWAIFTQTFGQPVRVGKYPAGSSEADKDTLFRAVANIAGDCAAIIPESMTIDFIEAANVGASHTLYKERADWFDQQTSKAVLGQTATTDAIAGGHAVGREHRAVQEDIERSDANAMSAILTRDLIIPWVQLERGPQQKYPTLHIGRAEDRDVHLIVSSVNTLVPMGMKVKANFFNELLGIPVPEAGDELLVAPPQGAGGNPFGGGGFGVPSALQSQSVQRTADDIAALAHAAEHLTQPAFDQMIGEIKIALQNANSLEDVRTHLKKLKLDPGKMAKALQLALAMAHLSGRADISDAR